MQELGVRSRNISIFVRVASFPGVWSSITLGDLEDFCVYICKHLRDWLVQASEVKQAGDHKAGNGAAKARRGRSLTPGRVAAERQEDLFQLRKTRINMA